ncbi:MAG: arginine:agmatine antiporter, partial [Alphaproteobacteria bacterium]|nr:arginine:agmatine antiporter [Alphaproteobacteria bacterium]
PAYFMSAMYLWKLCEDHEYPMNFYITRSTALFSAILASIYALWLIYAAGLNYLLMALVFMALGIPVYVYARHQNSPNESAFSAGERFGAGILIVAALFGVYAMYKGLV